ncbi:MAG: hypothetical protein QOH89_3125 [Pseudonocardiales bacterium]|nr:hypothetical protein [Pseudonocardiales bacterium]
MAQSDTHVRTGQNLDDASMGELAARLSAADVATVREAVKR